MRVKTEAKRQDILDAAAAEFGARGYHDTTLALVAERMGSSKATIYNYFQSKADLFVAMLVAVATPATAALLRSFDGRRFADGLALFARSYVRMHADVTAVALQRLMIAEPEVSSAVMRPFRDDPDLHAWPRLTAILRREQAAGGLRAADGDEMAAQLRALLHGDLPHRLLFGEHDDVTEADMDAAADRAVRMFLAAYAIR